MSVSGFLTASSALIFLLDDAIYNLRDRGPSQHRRNSIV